MRKDPPQLHIDFHDVSVKEIETDVIVAQCEYRGKINGLEKDECFSVQCDESKKGSRFHSRFKKYKKHYFRIKIKDISFFTLRSYTHCNDFHERDV